MKIVENLFIMNWRKLIKTISLSELIWIQFPCGFSCELGVNFARIFIYAVLKIIVRKFNIFR